MADRNKPRNPGGDGTGLMQSLRSQGENSLLKADVIGRLVRRLIKDVMNTITDSNAGRISVALGRATVEARCGYYAGVLSGRIKLEGFDTDPSWHPTGLADFIRSQPHEHITVTQSDEHVITEALALIVLASYRVLEMPESEQNAGIDQVVSYGVGLLGGIPI